MSYFKKALIALALGLIIPIGAIAAYTKHNSLVTDSNVRNQERSISNYPTLSPVPSVSPVPKQVVNSDPIVSCGPGRTSGQYIKDKQSNCKNYVDCGLNGNTVWTMMLKSECDKKHDQQNSNNSSSSNLPIPSPLTFTSVLCALDSGPVTVSGTDTANALKNCEWIKAQRIAYPSPTPAPYNPPPPIGSRQDRINACLAPFSALGSLDSSQAQQCYSIQ